jgi:hypothetical protein
MCAHQLRSYGAQVTRDDRTTDAPNGRPDPRHTHVQRYEVRVSGHLGSRWATWLDGMDLTVGADGTTVIRGTVVDQAALHGLLQKLRDLGVPLVSLSALADDAPTTGPTGPTNEGTSS